MSRRDTIRRWSAAGRAAAGLLAGAVLLVGARGLRGEDGKIDDERYKGLREVERYDLDQAENHFRKANVDAALAAYASFEKRYETQDCAANPYAVYMQGLCWEMLNRRIEAIRKFQYVLDLYPDSPDAPRAKLKIGMAWEANGDTEIAVKTCLELVDGFPRTSEAVVGAWRAALLSDEKGRPEAVARLDKQCMALKVPWRHTRDWVFHRHREAVKWLVRHYVESVRFQDALRVSGQGPDHSVLLLADTVRDRAAEIRTTQKPAERQAYLKAAQAFFGDAVLKLENDAANKREVEIRRAVTAAYLDLESEARAVCTAFFAAQGDHSDVRREWALSLERLDKWDDARKVLGESKDRLFAGIQTAQSFVRQQRHAEGIAALRRMIGSDAATGTPGRFEMARIFRYHAADCDGAVGVLREIVATDAGQRFAAVLEIAETYIHFHKHQPAVDALQEALSIDPTQASHCYWRMAEALESIDLQKAIAAYESSNRAPQSVFRIASCQERLKQLPAAENSYREIISMFPEHAPEAVKQMALMQERAGNKELAVKLLRSLCAKHPKSGQAAWSHDRLEMEYGIHETLGGEGR